MATIGTGNRKGLPYWYLCVSLGWLSPQWSLLLLSPIWIRKIRMSSHLKTLFSTILLLLNYRYSRSYTIPGASCFRVHHPADHALPGLVFLFGERPLSGKSGLLLVGHDWRGKQKENIKIKKALWNWVAYLYNGTTIKQIQKNKKKKSYVFVLKQTF